MTAESGVVKPGEKGRGSPFIALSTSSSPQRSLLTIEAEHHQHLKSWGIHEPSMGTHNDTAPTEELLNDNWCARNMACINVGEFPFRLFKYSHVVFVISLLDKAFLYIHFIIVVVVGVTNRLKEYHDRIFLGLSKPNCVLVLLYSRLDFSKSSFKVLVVNIHPVF